MIGPVAIHHILIAQTRKCILSNALRSRLPNQIDQQALDERHHVFFGNKRHLHVKLCKFRLAVGSLVFIAETTRYLEVAVKPGHHQQLLELLWGLRQSIKLACIEAAGNKVVPRTLRRTLHQYRRLNFEEISLIQVIANRFDDAMTQNHVVAHTGAAQIEIPVLETQRLIYLYSIANWKRRST